MALKISWTKRADKKFDQTIAYLENEWSQTVARNFVERFYNLLDLLVQYPEIGTLEVEEKNIRSFSVTKHNRLFYRIKKGHIILLTFFDTRQHPRKRPYRR